MADLQNNQPPTPAPVQEPVKHVEADRISVIVRNRIRILYQGDAKAVTSQNDTGKFDVLPEHSNFISVINDSITVHKMDGEEQIIPLRNGVIKVKENSVHAYIDLISADAEANKENIDSLPNT